MSTHIGEYTVVAASQPTDEDPLWKWQSVECNLIRSLFGECPREVKVNQRFWADDEMRAKSESLDQRITARHRLLVFLGPADDGASVDVMFWTNLAQPDAVMCPHAAFDDNCNWLTSGDEVLARVAAFHGKGRRQRGVIVTHTGIPREHLDAGIWRFVATAESRRREEFVIQLTSPFPSVRISGIYNLVSYPGTETMMAISRLLDDKYISVVSDYRGSGESRTLYPVRQAAYLALRLLGGETVSPSWYLPGVYPGEFANGFEQWGWKDGRWLTLPN